MSAARLHWSLRRDDGSRIDLFEAVLEQALALAKHAQEGEVAPVSFIKLYDAAEDIATWKQLLVGSVAHPDGTAAQNLVVEFVTDIDGSAGTRVYTLGLPAGGAILLPSQESFANYSQDFAGGTIGAPDGLVERVQVYNPGATTKGWARLIAT